MKPRKPIYDRSNKCWKIPLTHGFYALVDNDDLQKVKHHNWHTKFSKNKSYASRIQCYWCNEQQRYRSRGISMHRHLKKSKHPLDHVNGNGLDNRRKNLRAAPNGANRWNTKLYCTNTSGYKGVWYIHSLRKYRAVLKGKHIGLYEDAISAAMAYDRQAKKNYGKFASTNKALGLIS